MQDRYVADVGDFGKYGLLRCLAGITCGSKKDKLKLGVIWYLTPSCQGNDGDGRHLGYLDQDDDLRNFDPDLFDNLREVGNNIAPVNRNGIRIRKDECMRTELNSFKSSCISALNLIESEKKILGDATFYHEPLRKFRTRNEVNEARIQWWGDCCTQIKESNSNLIFMDPDNGLRVRYAEGRVEFAKRDCEKASIKHVYIEEVRKAIGDWKTSLILYHHLGMRGGSHDEQIEKIAKKLKKEVPEAESIRAYRYRRGSSRAFFILSRAEHKDALDNQINMFESRWITANGPFQTGAVVT